MFHRFEWERYTGISYVVTTVLMVLTLGLALGLNRIGVHEPNIVMSFILCVLLVSARYGYGPGIYSSVGSVLLFNFFFTRPFYTFVVDDTEYILTFSVMLTISLLISELLSRIQNQAREAQNREEQTQRLYEFSRHLTGTTGPQKITEAAEKWLVDLFGFPVVVLTRGEHDQLESVSKRSGKPTIQTSLKDAAYESYRNEYSIGSGTGRQENLGGLIVPLLISGEPKGVVVFKTDNEFISDEQLQIIKTCVTHIALSLERDELAEETREMLLEVEVERMRSALLSSISHDLRTPLATITGSAESLYRRDLSDSSRKDHEETIYEESQRMLRLVDNLLNMVRIESGNLEVEKEWYPIEDVIGSAMNRLEDRLEGRPVEIEYPEETTLVPLDGVLIEQVLINLIDNAVKYTPDGSAIEVNAETIDSQLLIAVADNGRGINPDNKKEIFRRFFRENDKSGGSQTGLGLAICKAIVESHGGSISVSNRDQGGARFEFSLPIEEEPPELPEGTPYLEMGGESHE
ncbi:MAG: DUF4118 domain-containing protein [bacterium]